MKKIVVLASGEGTTLAHLLEAQKSQELNIVVSALVVDRHCGAMDVAKNHNIPCAQFTPIKGVQRSYWDERLCQYLKACRPDLVICLGFLRQIGPNTTQNFSGKLINTHPSLLPAYGGKGMYGRRIYESLVANKEQKTGVTIHYVNENYDEGQIIAQQEIPIKPTDGVDSLELRVKDIEKGFLVETLKKII